MKERVGFIGLGLMGHGMAKNIVEKGWPLTVMAHRKREAVEDLKARGAVEAQSPRAVAEASDIVLLCVTGSPEVEAVILRREWSSVGGQKGLLVVDCSTSDPASTRRLAPALKERGVAFVDAPLSRTPKDAWEGTLDVMVGGDDADRGAGARRCSRRSPGASIPTGPVGTGHTMKLLNNFVSLGYAALYSEALALGAKSGLSPKVFDAVIKGGRMDCPFYHTFSQYALGRDRNAHKFTLVNALKDLSYLAGAAQALGIGNPVGAAVRNSFAQAVATGHGEDYVPMLSDHVAAWSGTKLVE